MLYALLFIALIFNSFANVRADSCSDLFMQMSLAAHIKAARLPQGSVPPEFQQLTENGIKVVEDTWKGKYSSGVSSSRDFAKSLIKKVLPKFGLTTLVNPIVGRQYDFFIFQVYMNTEPLSHAGQSRFFDLHAVGLMKRYRGYYLGPATFREGETDRITFQGTDGPIEPNFLDLVPKISSFQIGRWWQKKRIYEFIETKLIAIEIPETDP